jgi:hypothetical protein
MWWTKTSHEFKQEQLEVRTLLDDIRLQFIDGSLLYMISSLLLILGVIQPPHIYLTSSCCPAPCE